MKLSILIVNFKTRGLLKQFLRGLKQYPPSVEYEIIVVDNASDDGSVDMLVDEFSEVKLIALEKNFGYSAATNIGLKNSTGEFILFANSDLVVLRDSIDSLYSYLLNHSDVGACGAKLLNPNGTIQSSAYRFYKILTPFYRRTVLSKTPIGKKEVARFLMSDWDHKSNRPVDWLMSSCLMVRRTALDDVGLWDERFFVYLSDTDFCRRLWLKNWQVHYVAESTFVHYHKRESKEDLKITIIHIIDWFKYLWKWLGEIPPNIS